MVFRSTAFRLRTDDGLLLVVTGSTPHSSSTKNNSWTPSDKIFWIRACHIAAKFCVFIDYDHCEFPNKVCYSELSVVVSNTFNQAYLSGKGFIYVLKGIGVMLKT